MTIRNGDLSEVGVRQACDALSVARSMLDRLCEDEVSLFRRVLGNGHCRSSLRPDEPGLATGSTYEAVRVDVGVRAPGVEPPDLVGGARSGVVARHVPAESLWWRHVAYLQSRAAMERV